MLSLAQSIEHHAALLTPSSKEQQRPIEWTQAAGFSDTPAMLVHTVTPPSIAREMLELNSRVESLTVKLLEAERTKQRFSEELDEAKSAAQFCPVCTAATTTVCVADKNEELWSPAPHQSLNSAALLRELLVKAQNENESLRNRMQERDEATVTVSSDSDGNAKVNSAVQTEETGEALSELRAGRAEAELESQRCRQELAQLQLQLHINPHTRPQLISRPKLEDNERELETIRGDRAAILESMSSLHQQHFDLQREHDERLQQVQTLRLAVAEEEVNIRAIKASTSEQLRSMQSELSVLKRDIKSAQQFKLSVVQQTALEVEEVDAKKRLLSSELSLLEKEIESGKREQESAKQEQRTARREFDDLLSRRRQLEIEVTLLAESHQGTMLTLDTNERAAKLKLESLEKRKVELDASVSLVRRQLSSLTEAQLSLKPNVDDLNAQAAELEKGLISRKTQAEEELQALNVQTQTCTRSIRLLTTQLDSKREELEGVCNDVKLWERRGLDAKIATESLEIKQRELESEVAALRQQGEGIRAQIHVVKNALDRDIRASNDASQRVNNLAREEEETARRLANVRAAMQEFEEEAVSLKQACEREKRRLSDFCEQKQVMTVELEELEEDLSRFVGRHETEAKRRQEADDALAKIQEAKRLLQRECSLLESKRDSTRRQEAEAQERVTSHHSNVQRMQHEQEGLSLSVAEERRRLESTRLQLTDCQSSLRMMQSQVAEAEMKRSHVDALDVQKANLTQELQLLKEEVQREKARLTRVEENSSAADSSLQKARADLARTHEQLALNERYLLDSHLRLRQTNERAAPPSSGPPSTIYGAGSGGGGDFLHSHLERLKSQSASVLSSL